MKWEELARNTPDVASFWSLVFAVGGVVVAWVGKMLGKGLIKIYFVVRRPTNGHREGIVKIQIGADSSDKIPASQPEIAAIKESDLKK